MASRRTWRFTAATAVLALTACDLAAGQNTSGVASPTGAVRPGSYQRVSGASNPALDFYGGSRALAYAPQAASRPLPAAQPVTTAPAAKPFSDARQAPVISPYLSLDIRESSTGLPNYYAFVRPQLEQQRFEQQQQRQNQRVRQQLRSATAVGATTRGVNGGLPTTGHSTQYFNMGGYYPAAGQ